MSRKPLIAFIHHNRPDLTSLAVHSLRLNTPNPHEVLIIDNASEDDMSVLRPEHLIRNPSPLSFAQNCNLALRYGEGRRVILLNNDLFVPPGWLEGILAAMDLGHGIVGSVSNSEIPLKIKLGDRKVHLGFKGQVHEIDGRWCQLSHVLGTYNLESRGRQPSLKNMVCFFAVGIAPEVVKEVGFLDEAFIHGYEDLDYCLRAWLGGFTVAMAMDAYLIHFGGCSTPQTSAGELDSRDRYNLPLLGRRYPAASRRALSLIWSRFGLAEAGRDLWENIERRVEHLSGGGSVIPLRAGVASLTRGRSVPSQARKSL